MDELCEAFRGRARGYAVQFAEANRGPGGLYTDPYRIARAGLRVREIPITFVERRAGASKMTGSIVTEAMLKVPLLRLRALTGKL